MTVEPASMPVDGGLRFRVSTDGVPAHVSLRLGGTEAAEPVFVEGWVYGTAPALAAGSYDIELTADDTTMTAGNINFVEDVTSSVQGAVAAYVVALHELAIQAQSATDDQIRERIVADWDMRANAVDTAIHVRAEAAEADLENPDVEAAWDAATSAIESLQAQITGTVIA